MSEITLEQIAESDREQLIDIFNYYIENSFAAYPEKKVPYEFFDIILGMCKDYPSVAVKNKKGNLIGFGMLRPHNPMPAFKHTAEITYFISPGMTGRGIGSKLLEYLENKASSCSISCILASISSLNDGSIRFHSNHGFTECGRFRKVACKKDVYFDTVWMQKLY